MTLVTALLLFGLVTSGRARTCENVCHPVCNGGTFGTGVIIGNITGTIIGGPLTGTCSPVCQGVCDWGRRGANSWFETVFPAHLKDYDLNGDGLISLREFASGFKGNHLDFATRYVFHLSDKNGDGFMSAKELILAPLKFH